MRLAVLFLAVVLLFGCASRMPPFERELLPEYYTFRYFD